MEITSLKHDYLLKIDTKSVYSVIKGYMILEKGKLYFKQIVNCLNSYIEDV